MRLGFSRIGAGVWEEVQEHLSLKQPFPDVDMRLRWLAVLQHDASLAHVLAPEVQILEALARRRQDCPSCRS